MSNIKPRVWKSCEILRHIDRNKKVRVYRNLSKGCFSVKQGTIVRCHADHVTLEDVKFIVSENGRQRVIKEKTKNVHAFVEGYVVDTRYADTIVDGDKTDEMLMWGESGWESLYYNPYKCEGFTNTDTDQVAERAEFAHLDKDERNILAANASYKCEVSTLMPTT